MSENILGFMHHAMKKIINVHGKAAYPKKKLETAGIYRKFIQPIGTKCFYIFIGLWHYRVSAWCHLSTIFWE